MTIKEQDSEMLEMFNRKYALTEKINHNSKELGKIEVELERVGRLINVKSTIKLIYHQAKLRELVKSGKKILRNQIQERNTLAFSKVSSSLGVTGPALSGRYRIFTDGKKAFGT